MKQRLLKSFAITVQFFFIILTGKTDAAVNDIVFDFKLYDSLTVNIIPEIKNHLDSNVTRLMAELNVTCTDTFTVHIWNDEENYMAAMEQRIGERYSGSMGYVYGPHAIFLLNCTAIKQFAEHELAHCVSLHLNSSFANNPRWLWESFAIYEAGEFYNPRYLTYLTSGKYPALSELNSDFSLDNTNVYQVGYTILEFILNTYGKDKLIELITDSGDIPNALNVSVKEFEEKWKKYVDSAYILSYVNDGSDSLILGTCESGTGQTDFGGYWFWYSDRMNSGESTILNPEAKYDSATKNYSMMVPSKNEGNIYGTSGFGARLSFKLVPSDIYMPFAGIGLNAFNFTGIDSISFWVKVDPDASIPDYQVLDYEVRLQMEDVTDYGYYAKRLQPSNKWQRYVVALSDKVFRQPSWAIKKNFDVARVQGIIFSVSGFVDSSIAGNLWIDDVVAHGVLEPVADINATPELTHQSSRFTVRQKGNSMIVYLPPASSASTLMLFDISGKKCFCRSLPASGMNHEENIKLPALAPGLYIVKCIGSRPGESAVSLSIVR